MIFLRKRYSDTVTSQLIIRAAKTVNSLGGDAVITSSFSRNAQCFSLGYFIQIGGLFSFSLAPHLLSFKKYHLFTDR